MCIRRLLAFVAILLGLVSTAPCVPRTAWAQITTQPDSETDLKGDQRRIARLFYAGHFKTVVSEAGAVIAREGLTPDALWIAVLEAESRLRLGERDEAIVAYERTLPVIGKLNNVEQGDFAFVYFRLAMLARAKGNRDDAVLKTEAGLRLEPHNTRAQILLGELFNERGERARALTHFKGIAEASFPTTEERVVVRMKIDRLTTGVGTSVRPASVRGGSLHEGIRLALVPLSDLPAEVVLADVCVALASAWRIDCLVLPRITLPDSDVFVADRAQYDGPRVLDALERRFPPTARPWQYVIALAGRDLFGPNTSSVYSWQRRGETFGTGVMSAYPFAAGLDDLYERPSIFMRRVIIQAISTSSFMLGLNRPTNPECPTAFPGEFRDFQQKRARLCTSDEEQRDALLRTRGGAPKPFDERQIGEIDRVHRAYYLD